MIKIKYNITQIKLFSILYAFGLFFMLMLNETAFLSDAFSGWFFYFVQVGIICIGVIDIVLTAKKIRKDVAVQYFHFISAYLLMTLWSILIVLFTHSTSLEIVVTTGLYWIIPIFLSFILYIELKSKAVDLIYKVILLNYTCVIIRTAQVNGIGYFFNIDNYINNYGSMLEVHSVGLSIGLFLIYYYFLYNKYNKKLNWTFWVGIIYMLMCGKRIALIAFIIIVLVCRFVNSNKILLEKKRIRLYSIVLIIIAFLYLIMVKSGAFQAICIALNINPMSRFTTWDLLANQYSLSLLYLGKGIGFSMNYLNNYIISGGSNYWQIAGDVHNDILKTYIDIGCIPFIAYILWFIIGNINFYIKRNQIQTAYMLFLLTFYSVILMFTDNVMRYSLFLMALFLIPVVINDIEKRHKICSGDKV